MQPLFAGAARRDGRALREYRRGRKARGRVGAHGRRGARLALLRQYGLPTETDFCRDALADAARADKKIADGALHLIVPERIGCCRIETVPAADIPAWLADGGIV